MAGAPVIDDPEGPWDGYDPELDPAHPDFNPYTLDDLETRQMEPDQELELVDELPLYQYPPPAAAAALSFDDCEAHGVDGTLRTFGDAPPDRAVLERILVELDRPDDDGRRCPELAPPTGPAMIPPGDLLAFRAACAAELVLPDKIAELVLEATGGRTGSDLEVLEQELDGLAVVFCTRYPDSDVLW